MIRRGKVKVDGVTVTKVAAKVAESAHLEVDDGEDWVSRGALKLIAALDRLAVDLSGLEAADIGASTGGFTQVLLSRGVAYVVAVDVGRNQLAGSLVEDPRVESIEGMNFTTMDLADLTARFDLVTVDLSFVSLCHVAARLKEILKPGGLLVALVKPQFEVGRDNLDRRGVVVSATERARATREVSRCMGRAGFEVIDQIESPIAGADGNHETLLTMRAVESPSR